MGEYWTQETVKDMVKHIINEADYDLYKSFDPNLAEEPEDAEDLMNDLCNIVWGYLHEAEREASKKCLK